MILSLKHLNKYLPEYKLTNQVEKHLNELGFEVESFKPFSDVKGLRFAKVVNVQSNPNNSKLDVVEIKLSDQKLIIQTNNKILKPGDLTICFIAGSIKGKHTFAPIELSGIISQGMFASWSEIGYDYSLLTDKDQVLTLPSDFASLDDNVEEKLNLNDYLIEISPTANRNDANSYFTIASELAAFYRTKLSLPDEQINPSFSSKLIVNKDQADELMFLEVLGKKQTSLQEKLLLAKHGMDSKFNWAINLTNLCLLETGVPAHVYPRNKLKGNLKASLYTGKQVILGNKEINVENVLTIFDDHQPISFASVMGLENYKVNQEDEQFVFEIGVFNPQLIRHGAKEVKILSNSANQGSRKISKEIALRGMQYLQRKCKGLSYSNIVNEINKLEKLQIVNDDKMLQLYSGMSDLSIFEPAKKQLILLGFEFSNEIIKVPNYRYDVTIFADIIEELFRFYSYDNFKETKFKNVPIKTQARDNIKNILAFKGYDEARTFTLVSQEKASFNPFNFEQNISLMTFVSKEREVIRNSIISSLSEVVEYNQKRKLNHLNIFEQGMINENISVIGMASTTKMFEQFSSDVLDIINHPAQLVPFSDNEQIHYNTSAKIMHEGKMIGWIGKLHPKFDSTNALYAEFLDNTFSSRAKFTSISFEPYKSLDLTFELKLNEHIGSKIEQIHQLSEVFEIKQIDDFYKKETNTHFVTLRIIGDSEQIQIIDNHFNK
ncbi:MULTISPECIES: phenylalanine--tRNA ligase subunit beta [unclassified Mycoplasma]|uniref:phenylalanine--tRNA ligase subunit beta n=1 Tax=unclassified Mycoplasma TaxID=2683645 RepID=UPI00211D10A6|nr:MULTISPECIES: phenylalanine--tRNA ligase subunit beta [unclassified Mycoplasma]UUM19607.1 phenylalanine--tRNA ligase subunit beta [Mycoplasma sp. 1578d]UUM24577.1 phenylalanine--tRNA ligase subunit beta [Mycoplasma sp. 3686d]